MSSDEELVITIPESIVEELGLTEDMEFGIEIVDDGIIIIPKHGA
jgi:antitoxin component of MazEF toxin-antitoxin module